MEADFKSRLECIASYRPVPWDMIPDLGLYMDQVITFISRIYEPLYGPDSSAYLSAAMINNYVKAKLIPRPVGKKYTREQIALLAMIVALKQVSIMEDIRAMLVPPDGMSIETLYTLFCRQHQSVISSLVESDENLNCDLPAALNFAVLASGYHAGCGAMLKNPPNQ